MVDGTDNSGAQIFRGSIGNLVGVGGGGSSPRNKEVVGVSKKENCSGCWYWGYPKGETKKTCLISVPFWAELERPEEIGEKVTATCACWKKKRVEK